MGRSIQRRIDSSQPGKIECLHPPGQANVRGGPGRQQSLRKITATARFAQRRGNDANMQRIR